MAEKGEQAFVEHELETDWTRFGSSPEIVEAYKTIMAWSPDERKARERALIRRLDLIIMIPAIFMYVCNYLDRNSIAQARVSGLVEATNITQEEFSLVNGIFCESFQL